MKSIFTAAALVAVSATASVAQAIPDGEYVGPGDGSRVTMIVDGDRVRLMSVGLVSACVGAGDGPISQVAEGRYQIKLSNYRPCTIDVTAMDSGYRLEPQLDMQCSEYHGQGCGFYADVKN